MVMEINQINNNEYIKEGKRNKTNYTKPELKYSNDSFERVKEDKSNNNKFDFSEAAKNFGKGIVSPLTAVVKHPIAAVGMIGATVVATTLAPVLGPILGIGFGLYSLYQVGKGVTDAVKNYKNGEYDKAEKSFDKIGQGIVGTVLSAIGIKQGAKVAKEAKLMNELNTKSLSITQKQGIANEVNNGTWLSAFNENFSLLTTKSGIKSVLTQFKPSMVKTRFTEFTDMLKGNRTVEVEREIIKKRKIKIEEFKKTPEGIRRASLTDNQIEEEVNALYNEVFDKLEIPTGQRPRLVIEKGKETHGGSYNFGTHKLEFNPEAYKAGVMEMEDVIMHEGTHCQQAILRAGIPKGRVNQIVKDQLIFRIINGENEEILLRPSIIGAETMKPPKMSPKMKTEFVKFAEQNLYREKNFDLDSLVDYIILEKPADIANAKNKVQPLLDKLETIIKDNPDFVTQYANQDEALNALTKYSLSHNVRYNYFSNVKIRNGFKDLDIKPLSGEKLAEAEKSLIDYISTTEGNARISGLKGMFSSKKGYNQYQFSPEEVLAQQKGNGFVVEKYTAKIAEMKASGNITPEEEARLLKVIDKAQKTIEYKTKGLDYYKKYTELINNPENKELAREVRNMQKVLNTLNKQIRSKDLEVVDKVVKVMVKVQDVATTMVPAAAIYNLLDIINEDKKQAA